MGKITYAMKRARIEINIDNIAYNFEKLRDISKCKNNVIPTIKGNAYNVGIYDIVKKLLTIKNPQKKFFVFALKEGIELRKLFPELEKIFILNGILEGDEEYLKKYNLTPVINSFEQLELANKAKINEIVLQFNTGMNRSGINLNEIEKIKKYVSNNNLNVIMVMSHFCCADNKLNPINQKQIENFKKITKFFPEDNILKGLSASDGVINFELDNICSTCRPGLALYGYYDGLKPAYSIYSYIEYDGKNLYLPMGIANGFTSEYGNGNAYVLYNGVRIFVNSIEKDKIILDTNDKSLIGKEVIMLGNSISLMDFESMAETDIRDIIARIISNSDKQPTDFPINVNRKRDTEDDSKFRAKAITKDGNYESFTSTILEKRIVEEDGIVGYGATEKVKKGDKLATFFGGYLDGLNRSVSNKGCTVFVEDKNGNLVECEIFGKISMDQTIIKVPEKDYNNIKIGANVIIFDKEHPVERFEKATGKTKEELFFYIDKSSRVSIDRIPVKVE